MKIYEKLFKRPLDLALAAVLLTVLSPVFLGLIILLKSTQKRVFFIQERPGRDERIFRIYKFQTMSEARGPDGELLSDELRLGRLGRMLRLLSLDELPQLVNILRGDMSFVGPRPLLSEYLPLYSPAQRRRHRVRPGITGLAQVRGRNALSWQEKFELDLFYVERISFWLDAKIFFLTLARLIRPRGVSAPGRVSAEKFNGKN